MRFFIVSENGDSGGLAWKLLTEGNEVSIYIKNASARATLSGMVDHVSSIRQGLNQLPDVVLFDMVGMGDTADKLRMAGYNVVGGGAWNDKLELDRRFSMKAMESFGIRTPASFAFKNLRESVEFVEGHNKLLVLKPNNNQNAAFTFVPKTQDELLSFMYHLKGDLGVDGPMLLQEYIEGTEVSTEVWYAKGAPVPYPNSTFETKKLMPGDSGPNTGCQTSMVFSYPTREPRLVQQSLKKIAVFLDRVQYTGPLDINGIVRKGRFYGLEFTPRIGYSAVYALSQLLSEPLGNVPMRVAKGDASPMKMREGFGYAMRVSVPPYPYQPQDKKLRNEVYQKTANQLFAGLTKEDWKSVYPLDLKKTNNAFYTAGFDGVVCECTGYGMTPFDAEREAVSVYKKIVLANKQARLGDGARVAMRRMSELMRQGYDMPPFEKPAPPVEVTMPGVPVKEKKDEREKDERLSLAAKLNIRPGALADPRVKSGG